MFAKPIAVNFIVGSMTTYKGKPPVFNVMHVDPETMLPVDFETHVFDLVKANADDVPEWHLKYNYRDFFQLKDLSPQSFMDHSNRIYFNETAA